MGNKNVLYYPYNTKECCIIYYDPYQLCNMPCFVAIKVYEKWNVLGGITTTRQPNIKKGKCLNLENEKSMRFIFVSWWMLMCTGTDSIIRINKKAFTENSSNDISNFKHVSHFSKPTFLLFFLSLKMRQKFKKSKKKSKKGFTLKKCLFKMPLVFPLFSSFEWKKTRKIKKKKKFLEKQKAELGGKM